MELDIEQIIKALECCKSFRDFYMCDICPYYRLELADDENCTNRLSQDALALIKELTQAHEMLSESYVHLEKTKDELLAERARLTEKNERLKAEKIAALDTFAEKLKRYYNALNGRTPAVLVAYHIDQIKKEMTKTDQKCD